jgi:hypothetical protein
MSYSYSDYIKCPDIQDILNTQFLNNATKTPWPNGALQFVTSPMNSDGTLQRVISQNGKYRTVQLVYQPRFTHDSSSSAVINCEGGDEYGETSETYEIDTTVGVSETWSIDPALLAERCGSDREWVASQVMAHMINMERNIDKELADFIALNLGTFYDTNSTNVNIATKVNGAYSVDALGDILYESERIQWPGQFVLIGDGLINKYMKATEVGCCATENVDLGEFARQHPYVFLRDPQIPTALGNGDSFIALGTGAVQMLTYTAFGGEIMNFPNTEILFQGTIVNPLSGIEYDYLAKYDCGKWHFQLKLAYKFVTLPQDVYRTNDPLHGTNGVLQFTVVN